MATYASYDELELRRGARVRVMTALARAAEFRNPGASPRTEFLERAGFDAAGLIKSPLLIERLDHYYAAVSRGEGQAVWNRWRELADLVGHRVRVDRAPIRARPSRSRRPPPLG